MGLLKRTLFINGTERMLVCDPEKDSLADVVRRLGLTGTKIGCGVGQCGACSVILDGKVIRSCTRKMKAVKDGSSVTTIEGLGTAENLHPLQLAWIVHGGVQCGFCTPGFIVSAKGLLDENLNPTREEVRDWFQKHRNACRCTGYKQLVDAVMAAAKVMRGEMTMEELAFKMPEDGKIYGTYYPRPSALAKVLGTCDYGDDVGLKMPDTLFLAVVQPGCSHANILSIDTSEAEKAPGVVRVLTSKDVQGINRITWPITHKRSLANGLERPILVDKKVFRYGDVVAMVAADTQKHAQEAAKLVKVEYEQLPEYANVLDAMAEDAIEIHPGQPNIYLEMPLFKGEDTRKVFPKAAYTAEGSFSTARQPHLTIEPDVAQAYVGSDGMLTIHCKSLWIYLMKTTIATGVGYPVEKIRIIENPTGASFGYSTTPGTASLVAVATLALGRPVSLTLTYEQHMHFTGKRSASYSNARMACDEKGYLTAAEYEVALDKGAYSEGAHLVVPKALMFFGAPYKIPNAMGLAKAVSSNYAFSTAYRGYGSPQVYTASEQLMDMLAEQVGMDPFDFRYQNIYREGDTGIIGNTFHVYPLVKMMDKLRPRYDALVADAKKNSTPERLRGVGVACGAYNTSGSSGDNSEIAVCLNPDNSVTCFNTWEEQGQGGDIGALTHTYEAFRPLGLTIEQIHLVMNDTALCPNSGPAAGSRSHFMVGNAIIDGAGKLMNAMRKADGTYRTYDEMIKEGIETKYIGAFNTGPITTPLDINTSQGSPCAEYNYGVFTAEVEVEVATGKVKVLAMHCVADPGPIGNYLAVDGQGYSGMMHSIGYALSEDYSDVKKHATLMGAGFPYIEMIPDGENFTVEYTQTPRPSGPYGSSGCSEMFQTSDHCAVINAIYHACGVHSYNLPATPARVKEALEAKAKGTELKPDPYYLGDDFYEKLDYMKANQL